MGRRPRHLNPKDLGATRAWDARAITGVTSGSTLETWVDRCGAGNATQSTVGNRPTFTENSINGQPAVVFDSTDRMEFTQVTTNADFAGFAIFRCVGTSNLVALASGPSQPAGSLVHTQMLRVVGSTGASTVFATTGTLNRQVSTGSSSFPAALNLMSVRVNGDSDTNVFTRNQGGSLLAQTLAASTLSSYSGFFTSAIGGIFQNGSGWIAHSVGDIGAVALFVGGGNMSRSVEKRMEHHYALSYKLAIN